MIAFLIIILLFWITPTYLGLKSIYKKLPKDSTVKDLLEYNYSMGNLCLIPVMGYIVWIDNLEFPKIEMSFNNFLNKKIK